MRKIAAVVCILVAFLVTLVSTSNSCTSYSTSDGIGWVYCSEEVKRDDAIEECESYGYTLAEISSTFGLVKLNTYLYDTSEEKSYM